MIEQKELVSEQEISQTGLMFTKTELSKKSSEWCNVSDLPYPFQQDKELVSMCRAINFAAMTNDGVLYQLQTVSVIYQPNLRK